MAQLFSVDVGGTFTDLVVLDVGSGRVSFTKASTTPDNPAEGVLTAISRSELSLPAATTFFHGTTLGINTMLEHKGARTGLITTKGFRDVLEIARMKWPMYQLHWDQPQPLVPRYLRREVTERVTADGRVLQPLDEGEVSLVVADLVAEGVEAIAVCFLHSYAFYEHEVRVGEIITAEHPHLSVTLSHRVTNEYREYERTATTVSDAAIKPRLTSYIDRLAQALRSERYSGSFLVTRCDGGVMGADEAKERPIRTLLSGPASGVMGVAAMSHALGIGKMIGIDMGGTSFDASLVLDHRPSLRPMTEVEGLPLLVPAVELATIGAGGGSLAWIDSGGALNVGPESAGADPGPICFGRGGTQPTFTDACLVSGLLNQENILGGEIAVDVDRARDGIDRSIGRPLGLKAIEAASGIVAVAEAKMAGTLEELTIGKGLDPREFVLLAFGGGGPLVATALAVRLQVSTVIVPPSPGTFSAWGMLTLDVVHDFSRTAIADIETLSAGDIAGVFREIELEAQAALERERVPATGRMFVRSVDMRYEGQEHTLSVPLVTGRLNDLRLSDLRAQFDHEHEAAYGYCMPDPVEITAYRVRAVGTLDKPRLATAASLDADGSKLAVSGSRRACHRESGGEMEWTLYDRQKLHAGNRLRGPAIIEETAATTLVGPNQQLTVDRFGNLLITLDN
jgi:N-methylhydantoinase A